MDIVVQLLATQLSPQTMRYQFAAIRKKGIRRVVDDTPEGGA